MLSDGDVMMNKLGNVLYPLRLDPLFGNKDINFKIKKYNEIHIIKSGYS